MLDMVAFLDPKLSILFSNYTQNNELHISDSK